MKTRKPISESTWFYFAIVILGIVAIVMLERVQ